MLISVKKQVKKCNYSINITAEMSLKQHVDLQMVRETIRQGLGFFFWP